MNGFDYTVVGFTGCQTGMTSQQKQQVAHILQGKVKLLHHGDCIGSDKQAHAIAFRFGLLIEIHPPDCDSKRAFCRGANKRHKPKPYLVRNHCIVDASQALIATPDSLEERLRSGTWATVRYARTQGKPVLLVSPDGSLLLEKG